MGSKIMINYFVYNNFIINRKIDLKPSSQIPGPTTTTTTNSNGGSSVLTMLKNATNSNLKV
jgi:hypothetical protein